MVELNQCYRVKPVFAKMKEGPSVSLVGKVVYIHPKGRYVVLEFDGPNGKSREAFYPEQLTDKNRVLHKTKH